MLSLFAAAYLLGATYLDLYNDGHALLEQGDAKGAEIVLKSSASINPAHTLTLKDLAESYVKLKRLPEAIEQYQKLVALDQKDITARGRLAELYSWMGNYDKSIVTYRDALEIDPKNPVLKNGLALVLRWSHRYDEAERLYKEVLDSDPDNHEALKGLGKTYSMKGDLTDAREALEKAVKLYPQDAELYKDMGTVEAWQKDFKKAIASLKKSIELSPNYAEAYRTMGDVYSWMKEYGQATVSYKKASEIEPRNIENYVLLARIYKITENKFMAEESAKAALRVDPSDTSALELLREIRNEGRYPLVKSIGETIELVTFLLMFVFIIIISRSKKRMLRRKHRAYFYFINVLMPALVAITFVSYIRKDSFIEWLNISFIEEITEAVLFIALSVSFFALRWTENRSRDFSKTVILAIGAHPDDIELGCGGFIMKAKDSGASVYGLTMTRGEKGTSKNGNREEELKRAAKFMELDGFWIMDFPDTGLNSLIPQMKDVIEEKIIETGATVVFTHTAIDIHTDHQAVFEATKVAGRKISVLCYEDVSTPTEFVPNYFIDVTGYIEDKMKLITYHKSQVDKNYMDPEVIKGRAAHRGIQGGVQYAEAFSAYRLLR